MESLVVVRGNQVQLIIRQPEVRPDGTIWTHDIPVLGITDPAAKADATESMKAGNIPAEFFTRLGDNPNGLWVGTNAEWEKHPAQKIIKSAKAAERAAKTEIYLSSRGWGDYAPCVWCGDITRPDADILAECREALSTGHDVDKTDQTDTQLLDLIQAARAKGENRPAREAKKQKAAAEDIRRKIDSGFCFSCETWCHGDCGHYSNNPSGAISRASRPKQVKEATPHQEEKS